MIKKSFFLFLFLGFSFCVRAESIWLTDFSQAKSKALKENKPILIYFSGSDWCGPCKRMKKEIFDSPEFQTFSKQYLIAYLADFPRKKKNRLAPNQQAQNQVLAKRYNRQGVVPNVVLIQPNGNLLTQKYYTAGGVESFINSLKEHLPTKMSIYKKKVQKMGAPFEISAVATNKKTATQIILAAEKEIERVEQLISSWDKNSQTSAVNRMAGIQPVKVDLELFQLIQKSLEISELTNGAFDISFASIDKIWRFDGSITTLSTSRFHCSFS